MKNILIGFSIIAITATACNNDNNTASEESRKDSTQATNSVTNETTPSTGSDAMLNGSMNEMVTAYLQLKNALANDNGNEAASAAKQITDALQKTDETPLTAEQKKVYDEVKEDIKEHAEHITDNAGKIHHQREHFDMISKDMYDLVKVVKPVQTLYVDHCPMYNDNKGATWLSEVKEIKNPYYGKKMPDCGEVKEEIKP